LRLALLGHVIQHRSGEQLVVCGTFCPCLPAGDQVRRVRSGVLLFGRIPSRVLYLKLMLAGVCDGFHNTWAGAFSMSTRWLGCA
jgi:hypothetical protein